MQHLRVEGEPDLVRLPNGTIQNNNQNEYQTYIAKRRAIQEQRERVEKLEADVSVMKANIAMILQLLMEKK